MSEQLDSVKLDEVISDTVTEREDTAGIELEEADTVGIEYERQTPWA